MRVAIIAPHYFPAETGNAVTVRRVERQLALLGCELKVFPVDHLSAEQICGAVKEYGPQLLHAFHGYYGGRVAYALSRSLNIPYLVTLTGTDVYLALCDQRSHDTHSALRGAARIVAFHGCIKRCLSEHLPTLTERTVVIPQGVELPTGPTSPREAEQFTFLLPAGIRPIKNVLFPLEPLASLRSAHPQIQFILAGPMLDANYGSEVLEALEEHGFARYVGVVSHEAMTHLYRQADVVLNTSHSEGGMANTLLEAMAHGKAVLASSIEGNRSIVKEGCTGLLFKDEEEFAEKAELLITDPHLREKLGNNGISLVREKHSPEEEAQAYLQLYQEILSAK